ncbi:DNA polymerase III subunit alpha [Geitlerinema splendidum]|nr:DNA polymerase III subunit alpha [Geitlerinema splendidum]
MATEKETASTVEAVNRVVAMSRYHKKIVAKWKEVGQWWEGELPTEHVIYFDHKGIRREQSRETDSISSPSGQVIHSEDHTEDYDLRTRKLRDEKVSIACGYEPIYQQIHLSPQQQKTSLIRTMSGYSFGKSILFARELPRRAAKMGHEAVGLCDWFSLAGALEFAREAHDCGVKPLVGVTVQLECGGLLALYAQNQSGYRSLSSLITECHLGEPRLFPMCTWNRLQRHCEGVIALSCGHGGILSRPILAGNYNKAQNIFNQLVSIYTRDRLWIEIEQCFLPWEKALNEKLREFARQNGVRCLASTCATHAQRNDFPAQDILVCADTLCLVEDLIGRKPMRAESQPHLPPTPQRGLNGERYLLDQNELLERYVAFPELLENNRRFCDQFENDVCPERSDLPNVFPDAESEFVKVVRACAASRYGSMPYKLRSRLENEVERIVRLGFSNHFLVAWDMCNWAKEQGILFSGRGSVVDSVVAYSLGLSRIDAYSNNLHFDRFLPADGSKRPDIDIDFEARRRDDIRNYLVKKYGANHVATVAAFGAYCSRGIIREVGKAMGLTQDAISYLAKRVHRGVAPDELEDALQKRPELRNAGVSKERLHWIFKLGSKLMDVPRNIRAHSSGVIVSRLPIQHYVPLTWSAGMQDDGEIAENLRIIQWDKRSAKHVFDKFDILCLRGQDVLSGAQQRIRLSELDFDVEQAPLDDPETYRTMRSGNLIGIPQSASPAMRQAHMRIKTMNLQDASLVQAGIRPGVGGAVKMNELIARRLGASHYALEHPDLEPILGHTYGIVVFQEQIDQLLQVFAGYSGGEAEEIRDEIHKKRRQDYGKEIQDELIQRMRSRGYDEKVSQHVFDLVAAFKGYGFAQGHALAFAEISVRSIYCQQNYPAEYFASLLDAQPAGYYGPCTLANEARSRGVKILLPCVNLSEKGFQVIDVKSDQDPQIVFPSGGIRIALSQIAGLSKQLIQRIVRNRLSPYTDLFDFTKKNSAQSR